MNNESAAGGKLCSIAWERPSGACHVYTKVFWYLPPRAAKSVYSVLEMIQVQFVCRTFSALGGRGQIVLSYLVEESTIADLQSFGGDATVPLCLVKGVGDHLNLGFILE